MVGFYRGYNLTIGYHVIDMVLEAIVMVNFIVIDAMTHYNLILGRDLL